MKQLTEFPTTDLAQITQKGQYVLFFHDQDQLFDEIELPLSQVLAQMEIAGIKVDVATLLPPAVTGFRG